MKAGREKHNHKTSKPRTKNFMPHTVFHSFSTRYKHSMKHRLELTCNCKKQSSCFEKSYCVCAEQLGKRGEVNKHVGDKDQVGVTCTLKTHVELSALCALCAAHTSFIHREQDICWYTALNPHRGRDHAFTHNLHSL